MSIMPLNPETLHQDPRPGRPAAAAWRGWLISGGIHVLAMVLMYGIYWVVTAPVVEYPPRALNELLPRPTPPVVKPSMLPMQQIIMPVSDESEVPAPQSKDLPNTPDIASSDDPLDSSQAHGDVHAVDEQASGLSTAAAMLAPGGGGAPPRGTPTTFAKHRNYHCPGCTKSSENAVDRALRWLKRHQSPNGMWDAVDYFRNCTDDGPKCEPGVVDHGSVAGSTVAMTGYALLCFLSHGYDSVTPGRYRKVVVDGLRYLLAVQRQDGYLGDRNYENAVATTALCEAYGMSGDPLLKVAAQQGVDQIISHQNQDGSQAPGGYGYGSGMGWDYVGPSNRNDSSVSGWNVMALKSALGAGLAVGTSLDSCKRWLEVAWKRQNPGWAGLDPYTGESRFPYTYDTVTGATEISAAPAPGQPSPQDHDLTCVGGICAVFLGRRSGDPMLESLVNYVVNHQLPSQYPCNTYYMYYNTMTVFQVGGERWKRWNLQVRDLLVNAQRKDSGCFDGSWDAQGTLFPGNEIGRVLSTAYCCLSLEVYYRHERELELHSHQAR